MYAVELVFHGDLAGFLHRELRGNCPVRRILSEKTAAKDVIEACGVPHTEVDLIVVADATGAVQQAVDFSWQIRSAVRLEIHPVPADAAVLPQVPRLQIRHRERFVADGHLGTLARNLRLLGFDTAYERDADDRRLLVVMQEEERALLTRDRRLLMHSVVRHGYCPRSHDGEEQTREVLARFALDGDPNRFALFSRCLRCNGPLAVVEKSDVLVPLAAEPLTLRYYEAFRRCTSCSQIYWHGTHYEKLATRVAKLTRGTDQ